ncbi:MAG TPA: outer membrane protein assembly factor BamC [Thiolinea sp.]|nr:outer membrane protein assembly factor BamC [Thiolinea sp.]
MKSGVLLKTVLYPGVVTAVVAGLSACSYLPRLNLDAISDSVDYRSNSNSVASLALPPGLSSPGFDSTYTLDSAGVPAGTGGSAAPDPAAAARSDVDTAPQTSMPDISDPVQIPPPAPVPPAGMTQAGTAAPEPLPEPVDMTEGPRDYSMAPGGDLGAALNRAAGEAAPVPEPQPQAPPAAAERSVTPALSASPAAASPVPATSGSGIRTRLGRLGSGQPALAVDLPFDRTWQETGKHLPGLGLQITGQQPERGIITVRYNGAAGALTPGETYLILVAENEHNSFIGVGDKGGKAAPDAVASDILKRLQTRF